MIRIALCDDDPRFLQHLHQSVDEWFADHQIIASCTEYLSAKALWNSVDTADFDIFFLDIEMPEIGGMQLAKQIRDTLSDAVIIFLTSHDELASRWVSHTSAAILN